MNDTVSSNLRKIMGACHGAMDGARLAGSRSLDLIVSFATIKKFAGDALSVMDHTVKVTFKGGNHLTTGINGTREEVLDYYRVGSEFNVGRGPEDHMETVERVDFIVDLYNSVTGKFWNGRAFEADEAHAVSVDETTAALIKAQFDNVCVKH